MSTTKLSGTYSFNTMDDDHIYSKVIIDWENITKVIPNEVNLFEQKVEDLLVYLRLTHSNRFSFVDILDYCALDNLEDSFFYKNLKKSEYDLLESRLQELYELMTNTESSVFSAFKKKTDIELQIGFNYQQEVAYFYLNDNDVQELTPKAKQLKNMDIYFEQQSWFEY